MRRRDFWFTVITAAVALGIVRRVFGETLLADVVWFTVFGFLFRYVTGTREWWRAVFSGVVGGVVFWTILSFFDGSFRAII